ncbi:MAG: hypothetical protein HWD59_06850 [Coxiellaceae bacterium]|nr:MAG: hypothetical protein HWD59_06850 [Coxiellaceae bacterium]
MNIDELNEKLFPKKWRGVTLSSMDVDYFLCKEEEGPSLSTKSILGHSKWSLNKLRNLIKVKGKLLDESWSLQKIIVIY